MVFDVPIFDMDFEKRYKELINISADHQFIVSYSLSSNIIHYTLFIIIIFLKKMRNWHQECIPIPRAKWRILRMGF